jgi:hypothetical protein
MSPLAVILFLVYTWSLGFSVTRFVRESDSAFERFAMRIGLGLCTFILLGIILNTLRVPLDWRIFLFISAAGPIAWLFVKKSGVAIHVPEFKIKTSTIIFICLLAIFSFCAFMYISGAFRYNYFEDDDPWTHIRGVKYIEVEKTAFASPNFRSPYLDPYPPSYDMIFGILSQVSSSTYWVIKFFNGLMIALSVVFFFFFAREFFGSRAKALFATFIIAAVPAYLSHFIWAPALAMVVFFPSLYALEMIKQDRNWLVPAAVGLAALLLSHPTHAGALFGLVAIWVFVRIMFSFFAERQSWIRQSLYRVWAVLLGVVLSLFWWGLRWKAFSKTSEYTFTGGAQAATEAINKSQNIFLKVITIIVRALNPFSGTATRVYTVTDFFSASSANMINNPIGFGFVVSVLSIIGFVYFAIVFSKSIPKAKFVVPLVAALVLVLTFFMASSTLEGQLAYQAWDVVGRPYNWVNPPNYPGVFAMCLALVSMSVGFLLGLAALVFNAKNEQRLANYAILVGWLLLAFVAVNNQTFNLPVGLFAFRWWMILAIPVVLIATEGLFAILGLAGSIGLSRTTAIGIKVLLIIVIVAAIFFTTAVPKFKLNTSQWGAGAFWSASYNSNGQLVAHELQTYNWLWTLPANTKVFTFSMPDLVLGFDKYSCGWCTPEVEMKKRFYNVTADELHEFLVNNNYDYFIIGGVEAKNFGANRTIELINEVASSKQFTLASQREQSQLAYVFRTA